MSQARIIDGKAISSDVVEKIAAHTGEFTQKTGKKPGLAVVLVGEDPASSVYVRNKGRMAERVGFHSIQQTLPENISEDDLVSRIKALNVDSEINGILVQLPLPSHINEAKIIELIVPEKDVDGFHPINVGRLGSGQLDQALVPCTPAGCMILLDTIHQGDLSGLNAVIVGRSNIVGKPVAQLLLQKNATVTIAHSRTQNIESVVRAADIVVAAVGRAEMITGDWIKPGATVIDVGINRIPAPEKGADKTKLVGDVEFNSAAATAGAITPVPGGVGPMTIAMLMANTFAAACRQNQVPHLIKRLF